MIIHCTIYEYVYICVNIVYVQNIQIYDDITIF